MASPLKELSELNQVATWTEAVFVVLPSADSVQMSTLQKEVSTAAATITSRGTRMGTFLLSRDSQDFEGLAGSSGRLPSWPCTKDAGQLPFQATTSPRTAC